MSKESEGRDQRDFPKKNLYQSPRFQRSKINKMTSLRKLPVPTCTGNTFLTIDVSMALVHLFLLEMEANCRCARMVKNV